MGIGTIWRGERAELRDPVTGNRLVRISHHGAPDVACYYLNNGWPADGRRLAFTSLRTGAMNFYLADYEKDEVVQLTDHPALNVRRGSWFVDCNDNLYYWRTPELIRLNLNTMKREAIWRHPPGAFTSIPSVNLDGTLMIVCYLEHETLDLARIMHTRALNLSGIDKTQAEIMNEARKRAVGINLLDGSERALVSDLRACGCGSAIWSPTDPHRAWMGEGRPANPGPIIDVLEWDGADSCSRHVVGPRTDAELFDHVFWSADGERIMFKYKRRAYGDPSAILRKVAGPLHELGWVAADREYGEVQTAPLPFRNTHVNYVPGKDWLIGDGGFEHLDEQHVYRIDVKPTGCEFTSLAWHGNVQNRDWPYYREGYNEPNVKSNPQGTAISFSCSRDGISPDVWVLVVENECN